VLGLTRNLWDATAELVVNFGVRKCREAGRRVMNDSLARRLEAVVGEIAGASCTVQQNRSQTAPEVLPSVLALLSSMRCDVVLKADNLLLLVGESAPQRYFAKSRRLALRLRRDSGEKVAVRAHTRPYSRAYGCRHSNLALPSL